jgi:hypothetical protein
VEDTTQFVCFARDEVNFMVNTFSDIYKNIIPFMDKYPLLGAKLQDYLDFVKVGGCALHLSPPSPTPMPPKVARSGGILRNLYIGGAFAYAYKHRGELPRVNEI